MSLRAIVGAAVVWNKASSTSSSQSDSLRPPHNKLLALRVPAIASPEPKVEMDGGVISVAEHAAVDVLEYQPALKEG